MDEIDEFACGSEEEGVYYYSNEDATSDNSELYCPEVIEEAIEKLQEDNPEIRYNLFFFDEIGPYYTMFEKYYVRNDPEEDMIDLTGVVATADAQTVECKREKSSADNSTERYTTPALIHEGNPLKHTVGSYFLKDNHKSAILIPVADTVNRAQLREQHGHLAQIAPSQKLEEERVRDEPHINFKEMGDQTDNVDNYDQDRKSAEITNPLECNATEACKEGNADVLDFRVGYDDGLATGWALPVTTDENILNELKKLYPEYRQATLDDMWMFMRAFDPDEHTKYLQRQVRLNDDRLLERMSDEETLEKCVDDAGGWRHVQFVAFDVVTAMIAPSKTHILPLEMCFLPLARCNFNTCKCNNEEICKRLINETDMIDEKHQEHFFLHPGLIRDKFKVYESCLSRHGIPCSNMQFLCKEYSNKAESIMRHYLNKKNVILICNGGYGRMPLPMYIHAIRWLFAAANATRSLQNDNNHETVVGDVKDNINKNAVPSPEEIRCFDLNAVLRAMQHEKRAMSECKHDDQTKGQNNNLMDSNACKKSEHEQEEEKKQLQEYEQSDIIDSNNDSQGISSSVADNEGNENGKDKKYISNNNNSNNNFNNKDGDNNALCVSAKKCWYHTKMVELCDDFHLRCAQEEAERIQDEYMNVLQIGNSDDVGIECKEEIAAEQIEKELKETKKLTLSFLLNEIANA